jgi:alpha-beta hydrolase superfamily lysophospholipase
MAAVALLTACSSANLRRDPASAPELAQARQVIELVRTGKAEERQRLGLFLEDEGTQFKGCVIYLEGLGDSFNNHFPLFHELQKNGYRVMSFDYFGQGGSEGEMAWTRVDAYGDPYPVALDYEIGEQAKRVWRHYSETKDPVYGRTCAGSKKFVIGWSTGGLAAYKLAFEGWPSAVVLIAPGIVPNLCVGEASDRSVRKCMDKTITLDQLITQKTLTSAIYAPGEDPHLDPIKPASPMDAKRFVYNLTTTAYMHAQYWRMPSKQVGLVFLSGTEDTYVDRDATRDVLRRFAPKFTVISYEHALHEMDNEIPAISGPLRQRTVEFFDANQGKSQ